MDSGADWLQSHSNASRAISLVLCFALAPGMAWLIGALVYPGATLPPTACAAALILTLGAGYRLWAAYAAATLTRHLFGGFIAAFVRGLFGRRGRNRQTALEALRESIRDKATIDALLLQLRARAGIFATLGWTTGAIAGVIVGVSTSAPGFLQSLLLFTATGAIFGAIVSRLARSGRLPLPLEGD